MYVYIFILPVSKSQHALPIILVLLNWYAYLLKHMVADMFLLGGEKNGCCWGVVSCCFLFLRIGNATDIF